ncbi:MAG: acyl-CoA dehydrogenase [Betaproteobacteria bacterium]|nr:acyl-CoA dehydrogenase [Betaproteobacteria bacterium]
MSTYSAPLRDMQFVLKELVDLEAIGRLPGCEELGADLVDAVLEEAGKFATGVLDPLNVPGDRTGAKWSDGTVTSVPGFRQAYGQFVEAGWAAVGGDPDFGGQGLPHVLSQQLSEMWNSACMSFCLCPMLTSGAMLAIKRHGSDEQKQRFVPKLVSGEWTGTMNLTEPQAGSDLSAVRTRAVPEGDHYRIKGTKIFITWGEHDMTENIVHLVLARTPDAPEGVKGISLFIVPKFLVNEDGTLGARNDVRCVSIEHKLGIHGSPTAVMAYGDGDGAIGYLVGEENRGLEYMFTMMNFARLEVGIEGIAIAERAYQHALDYAKQRVQGREPGVRSGDRVTIIHHPDVRRMLMMMKSQVEAMRALAGCAAEALDHALANPDPDTRRFGQALFDLLTPVVKGWSTEQSIEIASTGVQIHGGMGFVEETGAAQYLRDARITSIYEGTTGIQANDLVGRKLALEKGATARALIVRMRAFDAELGQFPDHPALASIRASLADGVKLLDEATAWLLEAYGTDVKTALAGAVPYLKLWGVVAGGWQMARAALIAKRRLDEDAGDHDFYRAKLATARFFAEHVLPRAHGYRTAIVAGATSTLALDEAHF